MILGKGIKIGHKIKTVNGWEKVLEVNSDGIKTSKSELKFGDSVLAWKAK